MLVQEEVHFIDQVSVVCAGTSQAQGSPYVTLRDELHKGKSFLPAFIPELKLAVLDGLPSPFPLTFPYRAGVRQFVFRRTLVRVPEPVVLEKVLHKRAVPFLALQRLRAILKVLILHLNIRLWQGFPLADEAPHLLPGHVRVPPEAEPGEFQGGVSYCHNARVIVVLHDVLQPVWEVVCYGGLALEDGFLATDVLQHVSEEERQTRFQGLQSSGPWVIPLSTVLFHLQSTLGNFS